MTWTHTARGRALDLTNPDPDHIDWWEIGEALANTCRYNGNVRGYLSVAEHSVLISRWLMAQGHDRDTVLAGLLHDAAEAYTGDLTWPMQAILWGDDEAGEVVRRRYKALQGKLDAIIAAKAGIEVGLLHCDVVKQADLRILLDERAAVLTEPPPRPWPVEAELGLAPLGVAIQCWPRRKARYEFGRRLHVLLSGQWPLWPQEAVDATLVKADVVPVCVRCGAPLGPWPQRPRHDTADHCQECRPW